MVQLCVAAGLGAAEVEPDRKTQRRRHCHRNRGRAHIFWLTEVCPPRSVNLSAYMSQCLSSSLALYALPGVCTHFVQVTANCRNMYSVCLFPLLCTGGSFWEHEEG